MYSTTMNPREIGLYMKEGANDFLVKPSQFQDLCIALDAIIKTETQKSL
jgi:FixJ family two-component response regulator